MSIEFWNQTTKCSKEFQEGIGSLVPSLVHHSKKFIIFPGFCDVHVHFREPGFSYKETIRTGSLAAAHGGYTAVCTMPNLNPPPDTPEHLKVQTDLIEKDSVIRIFPLGTITMGRAGKTLSELEGLKDLVIGYSDDGSGIQDDNLMKEAMLKAKELGKIIVAHCEDNRLLHGGWIHDGEYAKANGHLGISSESEYAQIARDLELVAKTGVAYHVCHLSTYQGVDLIRQAKKDGLNVSCETAPHYLTLTDLDLKEDGRFKMNPPLRSQRDQQGLLEGILDGTIEMIATDHAPHSLEEKSKGLKDSPFGVVGLETAFPVLYTKLVRTNLLSLEKLVELMAINPRKRFSIPFGEEWTIWDLDAFAPADPDNWLSKGRSSPYAGEKLYGECVATLLDGKVAWQKERE